MKMITHMQPARALGPARRAGRRAQFKLEDWLVRLTNTPQPGALQRALTGAVTRAHRALRLSLDGQQGRVQIWRGAEAASGQPITAAYIGDPQAYKVHSPVYLQHILFCPGTLQLEERGPFPVTRARAAAERLAREVDLVIFEGSELLAWQPGGGEWVRMPTWVRMMMYYSPDQTREDVEKAMHAQKNNIRAAQRHGFTFEISRDEADFDFFYDHMHVPMIEERHTGYGLVDKKESMRAQFRKGQLFLVREPGGQAVAGALVYLNGGSVFGIANGILDGDTRWYDLGAASMLYHQSIHWCREAGIRRYDAGGVRPFTTDGLYFYKSRWGLKPTPDVWNGREWLFWAPHSPPDCPVLAWLRAHPPVMVEGVRVSQGLKF